MFDSILPLVCYATLGELSSLTRLCLNDPSKNGENNWQGGASEPSDPAGRQPACELRERGLSGEQETRHLQLQDVQVLMPCSVLGMRRPHTC